jgi:hypothetical protein
MQSKLLDDHHGEKTYVLIFQTGDAVKPTLEKFAADNNLFASHFTAIGAFSDATLAYFDWQTKEYKHIPVNQQVEVLAFTGDIADHDGKPKIHIHAVLGKSDGSCLGGHLIDAHVRPTLEVVLTQSPAHLRRRHDPESGLPLIRFS